jgi:biopolymer transport protein ExbB/biopolymer transport protein TolQ
MAQERYDHGVMSGPGKVPRATPAALDAATRASARSAVVVHREMKRGLNSLATITSTAPWIGLVGTILGVNSSFRGFGASKETILAAIFDGLSEAFVPTALGVFVAVIAMWCYKYLLNKVETFDSEMESASLQLINDLCVLARRTSN